MQSSNIASRKWLTPVRVGAVTDWGGRPLSKKIFDELAVGDVVRVRVEATEEAVAWAKRRVRERAYFYCGSGAAPYFEIVKVKDGTFWGKGENAYGTLDAFGVLREGDVFPFRRENIIEVPLRDFFGYSKSRIKKLEAFVQPEKRVRASFTGVQE